MTPYFSTPERIEILRSCANAWLGTPFRDHWRNLGVGVDCAQLAIAIYTTTGLLKDYQSPPYTIGSWKGLRDRNPVVDWIESSKSFVSMQDRKLEVGDLLCFSQGNVVFHLGIYLNEGSQFFVHAISVDGVCKRTLLDPTWARRLVATYRPIEP